MGAVYKRTNHMDAALEHTDADAKLQLLVTLQSEAGHTQLLREVIVTDVETSESMRAFFDTAYEELEKAFVSVAEEKVKKS